jgi:hypothetical protein
MKKRNQMHRRGAEYAEIYIFKLPLRALSASAVNYLASAPASLAAAQSE